MPRTDPVALQEQAALDIHHSILVVPQARTDQAALQEQAALDIHHSILVVPQRTDRAVQVPRVKDTISNKTMVLNLVS
jgi:hypothetical protein